MRWLAFTLSLLLLGSAVRADAPTLRDFSDWHVMCTDTFYCNADTDSRGDTAGKLQLLRDASAVYWSFVFVPTNATVDTSAPVTVTVDDFSQTFIGDAEVAPYGAANNYHFLGAGAQAVVDKLAAGKALSIAFFDPEGVERKAEFSLTGLTASLIFIDEFQTRLGSERVAGAAPEGMTVFDAEPEVPQRLLEALAADPQCLPMSELANGADIETDPEFGDGQKLYILPCWSAAYNFGWKVYVEIFEGEFAEAAFPEFSVANGWSATTHLVNYWYDPATQTVGSFYKGRGIGDCGSAGLWQWHQFQFRLIEFRDKPDCDGLGEPGEFPVVYTAPPLAAQPADPAITAP